MSERWILSANEWAAAWTPSIWRATWQGGLFIIAIWLVLKFFRQTKPSTRYWLWWIASLQLLVRLVLATPVPLPILPANTPAAAPIASINQIPRISNDSELASDRSTQPNVVGPTASAQTVEPKPRQILPSAGVALLGLWMLGVAFCAMVSLSRLLATQRLLRSATVIESGPVFETVQEFSADRGNRPPLLLESAEAACPLLAGWLRSAIVLPKSCADALDEAQLRMAVAHEYAHLQRRDLWFGIIPAVSQSLFFFHPLAWLATHEGFAAREAACDFEALHMSGGSPAAYARLLLDTAQARSSMAVLGAAFGFRLIQRRISMLKSLNLPASNRFRSVGAMLIAVGVIGAIPWSVTAQATPVATSTAKSISAKKAAHSIKKSTKRHALAAKNAAVAKRTVAAQGTTKAHTATSVTPMVANAKGLTRLLPPTPAFTGASAAPPLVRPAAPTLLPGSRGATPRSATSIPSPTGVAGGTPRMASTAPAPEGFGSTAPAAMAPPPSPALAEESKTCEVAFSNNGWRIKMESVDIHAALKKFFEVANLDFVIKSSVDVDMVTCSLKQASPDVVIRAILASARQPLTYKVESGVYTIFPKGQE